MKDSEKGQTQQKRGKDVIELPVALDAISTSMIEDLIFELKSPYTIIIATHNMQQAARISHFTAFLWPGELVENGETARLFTKPADKRTEDYITGRFG